MGRGRAASARPRLDLNGRNAGRGMLRINDRISIPLAEFRWDVSRSGGPGGQNVNKVNSKVLLRWAPATSPSLPEPVRARLLAALASRLTRDGELLVASQRSR